MVYNSVFHLNQISLFLLLSNYSQIFVNNFMLFKLGHKCNFQNFLQLLNRLYVHDKKVREFAFLSGKSTGSQGILPRKSRHHRKKFIQEHHVSKLPYPTTPPILLFAMSQRFRAILMSITRDFLIDKPVRPTKNHENDLIMLHFATNDLRSSTRNCSRYYEVMISGIITRRAMWI